MTIHEAKENVGRIPETPVLCAVLQVSPKKG
jgi:hypothetical protein